MPSHYHLHTRFKPKETRNKVIDKLLNLRKRLDKYVPAEDSEYNLLWVRSRV